MKNEDGSYGSRWQQALQHLAATKAGVWFFSRVLHHLDRWILTLTQGRRTLSGMLTGLPVVTLTTTRANGDVRHTPLLGLPYGDDVVVIATSWGRPALPGWYRDVRREQRAELSMAARRYTVTPRELEGEERALLWKRACAMYAGYAAYERRIAGSRPIPLIVLSAL